MIEEELWGAIAGQPNYEVSNQARIRHRITGDILEGGYNQKGYYRVSLIEKQYRVHILVAKAFIPNPLNLPQVHHKDKNKRNNGVLNLEWCTNKYNNLTENKTTKKISIPFSDDDIFYILKSKGIKTATELAKELGREIDSISKVWRGVNKRAAILREQYFKTNPPNLNEFIR